MEASILPRNRQIGRLAWRSPAGAMLWQAWGKHKAGFIGQGVLLLASLAALFVRDFIYPSAPERAASILNVVVLFGQISILHAIHGASYTELNPHKGESGFPAALLLKPVSTLRLAFTTILFGGLIVVAISLAWSKLVFERLGLPIPIQPGLTVVALFTVWWVQAIMWNLPNMLWGQIFALGAAVLVNLPALWLPPDGSLFGQPWNFKFTGVLLLIPVSLSTWALKRLRRGETEMARPFTGAVTRAKTKGRARFRSSFRAQVWLEWQRKGWLLPGFSLLLLALPIVAHFGKFAELEPQWLIPILLAIPIFISGSLGPQFVKFDRAQNKHDIPAFISARPVTNGDLLLAKLAAAALSTILTWILLPAAALLFVLISGQGGLLGQAWHFVAANSPGLGLLFVISTCVFLGFWTWKNLVDQLWIGFLGPPVVLMLIKCLGVWIVLGCLAQAQLNAEFKQQLIGATAGILGAILTLKVLFSAVAFHFALRRKVITKRVAAWITGIWAGAGLLAGVEANLVLAHTPKPGLWIWFPLAVLVIWPVSGLALAPIILMRNRHR